MLVDRGTCEWWCVTVGSPPCGKTRLFLARCHLAMGGGGSVSLHFCVYMCSICPSCAALPAPLLSALCVSLLTSFRPAFSALFIFVRAPVSPLPLSPCCSPAFFPSSSPCGQSPWDGGESCSGLAAWGMSTPVPDRQRVWSLCLPPCGRTAPTLWVMNCCSSEVCGSHGCNACAFATELCASGCDWQGSFHFLCAALCL